MVREVARSQQLQDQVDEVREAFAIVQRVIEEGQATGAFRAGRRRTPRELDLLRRARGGADRLGARPAPGQRGRRRARRADGDRARAARSRASRLGLVKVFNLNGDEWDRVEDRPGWRSKDAWVGAHVDAELIGGQHVRARARRPALAVPHAPRERGVDDRPARSRRRCARRRASRSWSEGDVVCFRAARAGRTRCRNRTDAPIRVLMLSTLHRARHRRVPRLGQGRCVGARRASDCSR